MPPVAVRCDDPIAAIGGSGGGSAVGSIVGRCERRCRGLGDNAQAREREERDGLREGRALKSDGQGIDSFCVDGGGEHPLAPCFRGKPICTLNVFQAHFLVFVGVLVCGGCESGCFATKNASLMRVMWLLPPLFCCSFRHCLPLGEYYLFCGAKGS